MEKLPRSNKNSFLLNLLQTLPAEYNLSEIIKYLSIELNNCYQQPQLLHGIRAEKMFGYVAANMGKCSFIKHEDIGSTYVNTDIIAPDYRIILNYNSEFFVEVKNCHKNSTGKVDIKMNYISKLLNYPGVTLNNLKIAIYWSKWKIWTLTPLNQLEIHNDKYSINMTDGLLSNEMCLLGDFHILAVAPLRIEFVMDISKSTPLDEFGKGDAVIKKVLLYSGRGRVDLNTMEGKVIFDLILYGLNGNWEENDRVVLKNNKIKKLIYEYHLANEKRQEIISILSSMITNKYNLLTIKDGKINKLQAIYEKNKFDCYLSICNKNIKHLSLLYCTPIHLCGT